MQLTEEEFRRLGYQAVDMAAGYLAQIPSRPVFQRMEESRREGILDMPLPLDPWREMKSCGCWRTGSCLTPWAMATRVFSDG